MKLSDLIRTAREANSRERFFGNLWSETHIYGLLALTDTYSDPEDVHLMSNVDVLITHIVAALYLSQPNLSQHDAWKKALTIDVGTFTQSDDAESEEGDDDEQ